MKRLLSVFLILMMLIPAACADNLAEIVELYNEKTEFTGVPKITQLPVDGHYFCMETGIVLFFDKSDTSDDIGLVSCSTFGKPDGEAFLCTVCNILNMFDPTDSIMNYGRALNAFIAARNVGAMSVITSNKHFGSIKYTPAQYTFYLDVR
jgi:hypothetical protein